MSDNNPLKQYFRRPTIYFKLPSLGTEYTSDVISSTGNGDLPVYPMTAIDEMTVRTPDGLFNGVAVVELIKSCVPNILDPWKLNINDIDAVLMAIKAANDDGKIDITTICPSCSEESNYDVNLMPILANMRAADYSKTLSVRDLEFKFRPLTYAETNANSANQFIIQKTIVELNGFEEGDKKNELMTETLKKLQQLVIEIVASTIEYIKTPETTVIDSKHIVEFLKNCDKHMNAVVKDYSINLREQSEMKPIDIQCIHCQHVYQQRIVLNASDFFD